MAETLLIFSPKVAMSYTLAPTREKWGLGAALSLKICSTMTKDNCRYFIDNCRCKIVIDMLRSESVAHRSETVTQSEEKTNEEMGHAGMRLDTLLPLLLC